MANDKTLHGIDVDGIQYKYDYDYLANVPYKYKETVGDAIIDIDINSEEVMNEMGYLMFGIRFEEQYDSMSSEEKEQLKNDVLNTDTWFVEFNKDKQYVPLNAIYNDVDQFTKKYLVKPGSIIGELSASGICIIPASLDVSNFYPEFVCSILNFDNKYDTISHVTLYKRVINKQEPLGSLDDNYGVYITATGMFVKRQESPIFNKLEDLRLWIYFTFDALSVYPENSEEVNTSSDSLEFIDLNSETPFVGIKYRHVNMDDELFYETIPRHPLLEQLGYDINNALLYYHTEDNKVFGPTNIAFMQFDPVSETIGIPMDMYNFYRGIFSGYTASSVPTSLPTFSCTIEVVIPRIPKKSGGFVHEEDYWQGAYSDFWHKLASCTRAEADEFLSLNKHYRLESDAYDVISTILDNGLPNAFVVETEPQVTQQL